jgi:3-deoxy-7-phosphoheptulonate synthase
MLESNLQFGRQTISDDPSQLERGVSVTDACIGWDTTAEVLRETRERLSGVLPTRPAPENVPPPSRTAPPENDD